MRRDYRDAAGNKLPGVTTVMDGALGWKCAPLMWWSAGVGAEKAARHVVSRCFEEAPATVEAAETLILEAAALGRKEHNVRKVKAGDVGSVAHNIAESIITGIPLEREPEWTDALVEAATPNGVRIVEYLKEQNLKPLFTERAFIGPGYGGTVDLVCLDEKNEHVIVDYKSGRTVSEEVAIQLGAYAGLMALEGIPIHRGLVIHCHPGEPIVPVHLSAQQLLDGAQCFAALFLIHGKKKALWSEGMRK